MEYWRGWVFMICLAFGYLIGGGWAYRTHQIRNPDVLVERCIDGICETRMEDPDGDEESLAAIFWPVYAAAVIGSEWAEMDAR